SFAKSIDFVKNSGLQVYGACGATITLILPSAFPFQLLYNSLVSLNFSSESSSSTIPLVSIDLIPDFSTPSPTSSIKKYISQKAVVPDWIISTILKRDPQYISSPVNLASTGHIASFNHSCKGKSSA